MKHRLQRAILAVTHPTTNLTLAGFLAHGSAKKHALHAPKELKILCGIHQQSVVEYIQGILRQVETDYLQKGNYCSLLQDVSTVFQHGR